jgi:hypothetical protein
VAGEDVLRLVDQLPLKAAQDDSDEDLEGLM